MVLVLLNWKVCGELCRKLIPTRMRVSDYKKKCKSCFRKEFQQGREQMKEPFGAQQNPAVPKTYHNFRSGWQRTKRLHAVGTPLAHDGSQRQRAVRCQLALDPQTLQTLSTNWKGNSSQPLAPPQAEKNSQCFLSTAMSAANVPTGTH